MCRTVASIAVAFACAVASLVLSGCKGDAPVAVKGRVTYNGAPLVKPGGRIVFVGPAGTQVAAPLGLDGTYLASQVPVGLNRVVVYYPNPASPAGGMKPARPKRGDPDTTFSAGPPPAFLTPYKYASADTSELSVKVEQGTVYNAELVGPKMR